MNQDIILETQRTYLRKIRQEDFDEVAGILGDDEVMYAWEHSFSDDEVRGWIDENITRYTADGYSYWAVILKNTERLIGVAGILREKADNQNYVGVGYIFHKAYWGKGFAFECADACKSYAFNNLRVSLLTAAIRVDNAASIRLAQKLGLSEIKRFNRLYRGRLMPHILFGCSR